MYIFESRIVFKASNRSLYTMKLFLFFLNIDQTNKTFSVPSILCTMNYSKKPGFNLYQSRHCAYIIYSVKTWKNLSVFEKHSYFYEKPGSTGHFSVPEPSSQGAVRVIFRSIYLSKSCLKAVSSVYLCKYVYTQKYFRVIFLSIILMDKMTHVLKTSSSYFEISSGTLFRNMLHLRKASKF